AHGDFTAEWVENEVTIDYNAAFVGACAGMYEMFGTEDMAITENFPPEEVYDPESEGGGTGYWVEAVALDKPGNDGSGTTQVSFKVMSGVPKPANNVSVRYYFDVSECANGIDGVTKAGELYDQSSAEVKGADGVLTGPFKYDKKDNTYYVEVTWDGYTIANSGKKYQFEIGMYYGDVWDASNDWSYQTMKIGKEGDFAAVDNPPEVLNENMCVYVDGVLVGGTEPDGTTPDNTKTDEKKEQTVTETPASDIVYGDANEDGNVTISDAVAILQNLANAEKYPLTKKGKANADVDGTAGVTGKDAAVIQLFDAGIVKKLPVES
ncbi:MAG: glycoside hydrolase, partial [Ruminococcus sp.]|nr:glycoside hydrolase [Ruminococcus sp.]